MKPADADAPDPELKAQLHELAELLISYYGVRAASYASLQALKARAQRKLRLMAAWQLLGAAVAEMLRADSGWDKPISSAGAHEVHRAAPAGTIEHVVQRAPAKVPGVGVR